MKSKIFKIALIVAVATSLLSLVIIKENKKGTDKSSYSNSSFALPKGWIKRGSDPDKYEMGIDAGMIQNGKNSATIKSIDKEINGFGTLMQNCNVDKYKGKRVMMSGFVKSENVKEMAGLWLRIDTARDDDRKVLAFDNMMDRPIKGTTDWKKYNVVLDVPAGATSMSFGCLLSGTGQVWFSDISFQIVGKAVKTTGIYDDYAKTAEPSNLNFSEGTILPKYWFKAGSDPDKYEMGIAKGAGQNGVNAATIKSIDKNISGFGTLMQNIDPAKFAGKHVRLSGFMKSENVNEWAGFWMRIDQKNSNQYLSFDNMQERPVTGKTDWKKYEIVLNVPDKATSIAFGALLGGTGQIWISDLKFEEVDNSVKLTGYNNLSANPYSEIKDKKKSSNVAGTLKDMQQEPTNLNFGE